MLLKHGPNIADERALAGERRPLRIQNA